MWRFVRIAGVMLCLPAGAMAADKGLYLTPADAMPITQIAIAKQSPDAPVTISADAMGADETNSVVIARGHVEVMQGNMILTADQITYYQKRDFVVAEGNVSMLQPSGDVFFADKAELKDGMKRAIINDFKARFADNSVLVANKAVKVNAAVTKLDTASYTPCNLCKDMAPFWQMNAGDATVDDLDERVTYHNAFMEFFGVPVFYTPYLSHPTPNAVGKSGFEIPSYATDPYFGSVAKIPRCNRKAPLVNPFGARQGLCIRRDVELQAIAGNRGFVIGLQNRQHQRRGAVIIRATQALNAHGLGQRKIAPVGLFGVGTREERLLVAKAIAAQIGVIRRPLEIKSDMGIVRDLLIACSKNMPAQFTPTDGSAT
jgi:lipopolysaccharide assembly outer membrane protein LptD (OstA)